jgi:hypothetical protein
MPRGMRTVAASLRIALFVAGASMLRGNDDGRWERAAVIDFVGVGGAAEASRALVLRSQSLQTTHLKNYARGPAPGSQVGSMSCAPGLETSVVHALGMTAAMARVETRSRSRSRPHSRTPPSDEVSLFVAYGDWSAESQRFVVSGDGEMFGRRRERNSDSSMILSGSNGD